MDTPRLLLVDDEPAITENLAPFLQRAGFEVTVAADGEEALRETAHVRPDLIVLAVLPRLDGAERPISTAGMPAPSPSIPRPTGCPSRESAAWPGLLTGGVWPG